MAPTTARLAASLALLAALVLASAPSPSLALPAPVSSADREVNFLLSYLNNNGFSTLATKIRGSGVPDIIREAVGNRNKLTLFAPRNQAWQLWSKGPCNIPLDTLLAQHVVPGNLTITGLSNLADGFIVGTLTAVPIVKQQSNPTQVVITTGALKVLTLANVTPPPASGLKWVQILSVDKVLNYPCTF